uniref:Uncharacterized protein n=1 Tax=Timema shepardi TaxID=629360 RepID=A0A7R9ARR5_TIMSH|nr:unnamed protein product [Timema shepardi]
MNVVMSLNKRKLLLNVSLKEEDVERLLIEVPSDTDSIDGQCDSDGECDSDLEDCLQESEDRSIVFIQEDNGFNNNNNVLNYSDINQEDCNKDDDDDDYDDDDDEPLSERYKKLDGVQADVVPTAARSYSHTEFRGDGKA